MFIPDVTLGEDVEEEGEEDLLDRLVREGASGGAGQNTGTTSTSNLGASTPATPDNNQLFRQTMLAISRMAEKSSTSSEEQKDLRKVITLLSEKQKRRREEELEEEEAVLIDEMVQIKDDSVNVIDMGIRQRMKNPNSEPSDWWAGPEIAKVTRPIMGQSMYLAHLMPGRVNPITIRKLHDRSSLVTCKGLSTNNSGVVGEKKMVYKLQPTDDEDTILMGGRNYVECKTVFDVVESVLNLVAVVHQIRPYSYEGLAIIRCLHQIKFFYGCTDDPKVQKTLLEKLVSEILSYNQRRGNERKFPASFKKCLDFAKEVAVTNGVSPDNLMAKVDPYCGRKNVAGAVKDKRAEELEKENAELKRQLKNQSQHGYGSRGGRNAGRGGRGGNNSRNQPSGDGQGGVSELTKQKLSETCHLYNAGSPCDGSCGLKHKCANVLRPGG